jgi:transposase
MPAARYVRSLTEPELATLKQLYRKTGNADLRSRCQMILLSAQGHSVPEIAQLTFFEEDTVLYWLDRYEAHNLKGLEDRPRAGRPPKSRLPL